MKPLREKLELTVQPATPVNTTPTNVATPTFNPTAISTDIPSNFAGLGSKQSSTVQNPYFDPADVSAFKETLYYGDKFAPRAEQIKLGLAKGFNANPNIGNTQGAMTSLLNLGINPVGKSTKELQKELFDMDYKNNNNEVLREVYNTYLNTEQGNKAFGNKEWEELTTEQRRQFFEDDINGVRTAYMQKRLQPQTQITFKPKEERPSDQITPNNYPTTVAEGDKKGKRSNTLIPRIGNTYPIEPIQKLSLTPYDYNPNLINPQAQINEITRGNYIGNTTTDRSKKAQEWTNDYAAIQNIMGSVTNQNTQLKNQASQINNTNRQNINQLNLGYGQTFLDNIAQRNAVVTQQQMIDNNAYTKALTDQNHEASTIEYLKTAYPTEFAAMMASQPVSRLGKAKYGGKIKLKPKKKK